MTNPYVNMHDAPLGLWKKPQVKTLMLANGIGYGHAALRCIVPAFTGLRAYTAISGWALSARGGKAPYTFGVYTGVLPVNITLNINTGVFSGIPTTPGAYYLRFYVEDSTGAVSISQPINMIINPDPLGGVWDYGGGWDDVNWQ